MKRLTLYAAIMLCYSTTLSNALNAPSNLKATAVSSNRINLRWTDNAEFESGFKAVASWAEARLGVPSLGGFSGLRRLFDKKVRGNIFQLWLEELGVPDTYGLVTRLVDIYRNHDPLLVPFPEVPGSLRELSSALYQMKQLRCDSVGGVRVSPLKRSGSLIVGFDVTHELAAQVGD